MTIVSQELARISRTLGRGVSDLGYSRLAGERQKTRSAELDYRLGRNRAYDERAEKQFELQAPGLKLGALQSEAAIKQGEQVATWGAERGDDIYKNMVFARTIAPKLMKLYDAEPDMTDGVFKLKRKDGTFITEFDRDQEKEAAAILSSYKVSSTYRDQISRIEEKEQMLNEQGIPVTDPAYAKLEGNKAKAQAVLDSPEKMIQVLRSQLSQLQKFGHYPEDIKRIKGEIKVEEAKSIPQALLKLKEREVVIKEKAQKTKGKYGGVTRYQYEQLIRKDRDFARHSQKDQLALIATIVDEYDSEFKNEMTGGYFKDAPNKFKYIQEKIAERAAIIKGEGLPGEVQGEQSISVNQKTGIVRIEYPDGKVEYYNQNKERVTEDGTVLKNLQKIKQ